MSRVHSRIMTSTLDSTAGTQAMPCVPAVRLHNLHVAWDSNLILHGVCAEIPEGQTVAITGSNGSGKSTLLRALMGTAPITSGHAQIFGTNVADRSQVPWDRVGYVPQRFASGGGISATVEEVVRAGLLGRKRLFSRSGDRTKALNALEQVGLAHRRNDSMSILSGGQQQRVLIARALVRNPDLLIMDEPMAGIDAHSRSQLAKIIAHAQERRTTIMLVLHELGELADLLDRELHLRAGHIAYDGPVDDPETHPHTHTGHSHHPDTTAAGHRSHHYSGATMQGIVPGGSDV